jgi:transposase
MPELKYINQSAYWDYQRDKIYIRSNERLKRISKTLAKSHPKSLPASKVITCPRPPCCPRCEATAIVKSGKAAKVVYDLKFSKAGIKRWIVRYLFQGYLCRQCGARFYPQQKRWTRNKYGSELIAYVIYQIVDLQMPQLTVARCLRQLFNLNLDRHGVNRLKVRAAQFYKKSYEAILHNIVNGKLIHADETRISIEGKCAYVWVLTNLEEVAYFYTETREGEVVQSLLREFNGVLVSDFYAAYDSINCPQQKCLIHLMRDLNDDLLKEPFNEEFKALVREFATLLKPVVETIDRFGLQAKFLRKHKVFVERFYNRLFKRDYQNDRAA